MKWSIFGYDIQGSQGCYSVTFPFKSVEKASLVKLHRGTQSSGEKAPESGRGNEHVLPKMLTESISATSDEEVYN